MHVCAIECGLKQAPLITGEHIKCMQLSITVAFWGKIFIIVVKHSQVPRRLRLLMVTGAEPFLPELMKDFHIYHLRKNRFYLFSKSIFTFGQTWSCTNYLLENSANENKTTSVNGNPGLGCM